MEYVLTKHARERKTEYRITDVLIKEALDNPSEIGYDDQGNVMIKKRYQRRRHPHVLIIVGVEEKSVFRIITLITSSKIKKYLKHA